MVTIEGRALRIERWGMTIEVEKNHEEFTKIAVFFGEYGMRIKPESFVSVECFTTWKTDDNGNWTLRFYAASGYKLNEDEEKWEEIERVKIERDQRTGNGKRYARPSKPYNRNANRTRGKQDEDEAPF